MKNNLKNLITFLLCANCDANMSSHCSECCDAKRETLCSIFKSSYSTFIKSYNASLEPSLVRQRDSSVGFEDARIIDIRSSVRWVSN